MASEPLQSVGMRSPEKLLEESKGIFNGGLEVLNSNFAEFAASLGIGDATLPKGDEKPQERRPGLGRKRARFSLKPNSSQPYESLEPSLNIDQLEDPEEFFSAVEKLENAKKEIERQKVGSIPVLNDYDVSQNARRRRPGILGKSVTYKHRYSSVLSENEETLISSQELLEPHILSTPNSESHKNTIDSDVELGEIDVAAIIKTENRVHKILDELLSSNSEDLDGDGAVSLLQERLQIKPIELSALSIPDFHDIGRTNYMALGKSLPKARRTSLDLQNLLKGTSKETPVNHKQMEESAGSSVASPTPPKSPFASISLLKKRILQSNPLRDPFSPLNVDLSTPCNLSSVNQVDSQSDEINGIKQFSLSSKLKSLTEDEIITPTVSNKPSEKVITGGLDGLADQPMNKSSSRQNPCVEVRPNESHGNLGVSHDSDIMKGRSMAVQNTETTDNDDLMDGPDQMEKNVEDGPSQVVSSANKHISGDDSTNSASVTDGHKSSQLEENDDNMPSAAFSAHVDINIEELTIPGNLNSNQRLSDESHLATSNNCTMDVPLTVQENDSERETEKAPSKNGQQKRKRPPVGTHERRILSLRPSIADAGTFFESGMRRSKRIKMRPLEYWKGERFLYGRVNDSLKLIGLRYISPSKDDGKLKVKSYISDECNELLELAAKH